MKDCVVGKVYFLLVRIKIKYMEVALVRKETIGQCNSPLFPSIYSLSLATAANTESETIAKYEVMDGCPTKG